MERKSQPFIAAAVAPPLRPECREKAVGSETPSSTRRERKAFKAAWEEKAEVRKWETPWRVRKDGKRCPVKGRACAWKAWTHC